MMAMSDRAQLALIILATLGFVSVLLSDAWTRYFARGLTIRKHDIQCDFVTKTFFDLIEINVH